MLTRTGEEPLRYFLAPIADVLADPRMREVVINKPGEVAIEYAGGWITREIP